MRFALVRALVSMFWLATASYAFLCTIPFAWTQLVETELVPGVALFARLHAWLSIVVLGLTAAVLSPHLRAGRPGAWALVGVWVAAIAVELATGGLSRLEPSALALFVSLAALVPATWLALLDLRAPGESTGPSPPSAGPVADFLACAAAAVVVSLGHAVPSLWAGDTALLASFGVLARSAALHGIVFAAIFGLLSMVRGAGRLIDSRGAAEAWFARAALAGVLALFLNRVLLVSLAQTGPGAWLAATAFGLAMALQLSPRGGGTLAGIERVLRALGPRWAATSPAKTGLWLVLVMAVAVGLETAISGFDWNFVIATTVAFASWLVALAAAIRVAPPLVGVRWAQGRRALAPFAAAALRLVLYQLTWTDLVPVVTAAPRADASTRFIAGALTPAAPVAEGLYEFLQENTNIPRDVHVAPVDVAFASLSSPAARRPHIFLFVVDSLRRDYVSPYNGAVTFTPSIGEFASESVAFERAFTRYGATGLSVPSIWVGGMILHKQYVTPFAPMNALAALLSAGQYTRWLSRERILETILPASDAIDALDRLRPVADHRFCRTLEEVRGRLHRLSPDRPTFVYTLPQDIHVATIAREGGTAVDSGDYGAFNAAYASRVRRMDACFGEFIADLKRRDLYDASLIILTSDHGDSLGEQGRMGHAYTIFPEIVQVPMLIHLPADVRSTHAADLDAPAFTSDLTPSLYALLGHAPVAPSRIFGRPLFHAARLPEPGRGIEVVASSYGSVYGALIDDAERLYILDGVSLREYLYELDGSGAGREVGIDAGVRQAGQEAIRSAITEVARFYRYHR